MQISLNNTTLNKVTTTTAVAVAPKKRIFNIWPTTKYGQARKILFSRISSCGSWLGYIISLAVVAGSWMGFIIYVIKTMQSKV